MDARARADRIESALRGLLLSMSEYEEFDPEAFAPSVRKAAALSRLALSLEPEGPEPKSALPSRP